MDFLCVGGGGALPNGEFANIIALERPPMVKEPLLMATAQLIGKVPRLLGVCAIFKATLYSAASLQQNDQMDSAVPQASSIARLSKREHRLVILAIFLGEAAIDAGVTVYLTMGGRGPGWGWNNIPEEIFLYFAVCALWYLMFRAMAATFTKSTGYRIVVAFSACLLATVAFTLIVAWARLFTGNLPKMPDLQSLAIAMLWFAPVFIIWSLVLLGLAYALDARERGRLLLKAHQLTQEARLQALRHQLNPHFLHNTLNSVASLISDRAHGRAEEMVMRLSKFLRAGLSQDPTEDIPLEREVSVQAAYLDIERVRFDEQLRTHFEIPAELMGAMVPNFILQPLVENAVKHGLAPYPETTNLTIRARQQGDWLVLEVVNSCQARAISKMSTGIGMANVQSRLRTRFGDRFSFTHWRDEHSFRVEIQIPLTFESNGDCLMAQPTSNSARDE